MEAREGRLSVFSGAGKVVETHLRLPRMAESLHLDAIYREHIDGTDARYAVIRENKTVIALFLARDLLPARVRRLGRRAYIPGRWATTAVELDVRGKRRGILGPGLFFRIEDLRADERWMASLLTRFTIDVKSTTREFDDGTVHEWWAWDELWLHADYNGQSRLFGAGNTDPDRVREFVDRGFLDGADTYLWGIGAIPLE